MAEFPEEDSGRPERLLTLTEKGESYVMSNYNSDRKKLLKVLDDAELWLRQPEIDEAEARRRYDDISARSKKIVSVVQRYGLPQDSTLNDRTNCIVGRLIQVMRPRNGSLKSHHSKITVTTNKSSASKKAQLAADALKTQLRHLREEAQQERELEEMNRKLKERTRQLQEQRLANELERQQQEAAALQALVEEEDGSTISSDASSAEPLDVGRAPSSESHASLGDVNADKLAQCIAQAMALSRLPVAEPPVFSGDPLLYPDWVTAFDTLIEGKGITEAERIHYLKRYLGGKAKESVSSLFHLRSNNAYRQARAVLEERYGNGLLVAEAFRSKLEVWPKILVRDRVAIREFSDFLNECRTALLEIPDLQILNDIREIQRNAAKLPDWLFNQWTQRLSQIKAKEKRYPNFDEFARFVQSVSDSINDPALCLYEPQSRHSQDHRHLKRNLTTTTSQHGRNRITFATNGVDGMEKEKIEENYCINCKRQGHTLANCRTFAKKDKQEKTEFIKRENVCFSCLRPGHVSRACRNRLTCTRCEKQHPTCLHIERKENSGNKEKSLEGRRGNFGKESGNAANNATKEANCKKTHSVASGLTSMILPVYVSRLDCPEKETLVYALLDTMSDTTFITTPCAQQLNAASSPTCLRLTTITDQSVDVKCHKYANLAVRGYHSRERIPLPTSYSRDVIPVSRSHIPTPASIEYLPHLRSIQSHLVPELPIPVGLLIGYNCPAALAPVSSIVGPSDQPFAVETVLGWSVVGGSSFTEEFDSMSTRHAHQIIALPTLAPHPEGSTKVSITLQARTREVSPTEVLQLMERDFMDNTSCADTPQSHEDRQFIKILTEGIEKRPDGHYEMPLPFKTTNPTLPNNRKAALHRALSLCNKLQQKPVYKKHYTEYMNQIIAQGEAEKVPLEELSTKQQWYIPHHGVYHPKKPDKLRIVFDCSARYSGHCLNDILLQGPDLLNSLVGVLCRFRLGPVAFSCDVKQMFHQFRVKKEHQDFLRFLWWENGDLTKPICDYRMKVHLFGATSSPGCANFGLRQIAKDNAAISPEASTFLLKGFYVDDGLRSEETSEKAQQVLKDAQNICSQGNLKLHKVVSNCSQVLQCVTAEERASPEETSLGEKLERTLGVQWCTTTDTFRFHFDVPEHPNTRRGVLAIVASIYDPLGFLAPLILLGKLVSQALCGDGLKWDDEIPENLLPQWENWKEELQKLTILQIPRCIRPLNFGIPTSFQLHHFSDASTRAYGQCSCIRLENERGEIHCSLMMAKARVAPLKPTTIPRLELQAAVLSAKMSKTLEQELGLENVTHHFWTDSKVVLGYIKNEKARFHVYVANRIGQIREVSEPHQWNYVPTSVNPADHASRGLKTFGLKNSNWFTGPTFLYEKKVQQTEVDITLAEDDPEVKSTKDATALKIQAEPSFTSFEDRMKRFSSYERLLSAFSVIVKCCARKKGSRLSNIEAKEKTLQRLIMLTQGEAFHDTNFQLKTNPLQNLNPFFDKQKMLRVGGRLRKTSDPMEVKHPLILPNKSHLSLLIARHFHEKTAHQGRNLTINELRSKGFWIINCRRLVSSIINSCVKCIRMRKKPNGQQMADLPEERVEPSPPFTHCGVDVFGPFIVKEGRKEMKRYGLIFTCLALRAVHIEVLDDLTSDSFMNGLRCFAAIRGNVRTIFCDNGTNFVGAKNELKDNLKLLDMEYITRKMEDTGCEFRFNTPTASHKGGVWERQIRTVRSVLTGLLGNFAGHLDTTSLRTLLYEAMAIVNSRPLTVNSLERPDDPCPLTPNHLLTMKSGVVVSPPPGTFVREDMYLKRRWKRVQYLANQFWNRWKKEFLQNLQCRNKWQNKQANIEIGDIVILHDDSPRMEWKLGRVVETFPGDDGLVRTIRLRLATPHLDSQGKPTHEPSYLLRPVNKVVTLIPSTAST